MILDPPNWYHGYHQILADKAKVLLCYAPTVDSLATLRIWTHLLQRDGMEFAVVTDVPSSLEEYTSIILINRGATRNISKWLPLNEETKVYVMDSARPIHLANIHAGQSVVVFDEQMAEEVPSDGDQLSIYSSSSEESDSDSENNSESDSESETDNSDDDEGEQEFEADLKDTTEFSEEEPTNDIDADDEASLTKDDQDDVSLTKKSTQAETNASEDASVEGSPKKLLNETMETVDTAESPTQQSVPPLSARERFAQRRQRIRDYYGRGNFHGMPASFVAYQMAASQLRFGQVADLLWWACLGLTDAHLHHRIDAVAYAQLALDLQTHVHTLFPNTLVERVGRTVYAEQLTQEDSSNSQTALTFSQQGTLLAETEFRLFMLRHSSLYDSLLYSEHIRSRWHDNQDLLKEVLARMGLPLTECRQPFAFMKPSLKRQLPDLLQQHMMDEFDEMGDLKYSSFLRVEGYGSLTSAADVVYAVSALLEQEEDPAVAQDALSGEWRKGIGRAKRLQVRMLDLAHSLIEQHKVVTLYHFRYAYITVTNSNASEMEGALPSLEDTKAEPHMFAKPLALSRVAHYLFDINAQNGRWVGDKARPLVLLAEDPIQQSHLVGGFMHQSQTNRFKEHFRLAAESLQSDIRLEDAGDSHFCSVPSRQAQRFMEQLHYLMDSM